MTFNPATSYVDDWRWTDWVEDAEYRSQPDAEPKRKATGLKAKLGDQSEALEAGLGTVGYDNPTLPCTLWPVSQPDLAVDIGGVLRLAESGAFVIIQTTKSRFGHWSLVVQPERENADYA